MCASIEGAVPEYCKNRLSMRADLQQRAHARAAEDLPHLLHVLGLLRLAGGVQVAQRGQTVLQLLARVARRVPRQSVQ